MIGIKVDKIDVNRELIESIQLEQSDKQKTVRISIRSGDHDKVQELYPICKDYDKTIIKEFFIGTTPITGKFLFIFHEGNYNKGRTDVIQSFLRFDLTEYADEQHYKQEQKITN